MTDYRYRHYKSAVAYVATSDSTGKPGIGSAFHIGEGVFVTAKHVVHGLRVTSFATTVPHRTPIADDPARGLNDWASIGPFEGVPDGPFTSNDGSDVALLVLRSAAELPALRLGRRLEHQEAEGLVLAGAVVMGYPPVPMTAGPTLIALNAEVNAVTRTYKGARHFILSSMARGGFSGGPVLVDSVNPVVIGLVTDAHCENDQPPELGFMGVLSVDAIVACLEAHGMMPALQTAADGWRGALGNGT